MKKLWYKIADKYSLLALVFSLLIIGNIYLKYSYNYVMSWDVYGYYLYLPQTIIHNDLGMENDSIIIYARETYPISTTFYQRAKSDLGKWVIKYPVGMAYIYLPAFLSGHLLAYLTCYELNGFSPPYEDTMFLLCFISIVIGLIFVRKILLHYFNDITTSLCLLLIALGTNYLSTVTLSVAMPHNFLFTLFAINLWLTIKWWESFKLKYAVLLGIFIGISVAARFTSAIFIIILLFWDVSFSYKAIKDRLVLIFTKRILQFSIIGLIVFLLFLPQMIYWKIYAGTFIYDSYQNPGEGLDLMSPHTFSFLFSYQKGWLLYTPLMIFAFMGLIWVRKKKREMLFPLVLFLLVNIWVLSSWTTWWYAESFSQRPMVDSYPLMALLLGFFVEGVMGLRRWLKTIFISLVIFLLFFQLFQNWQFNRGIINASRMTKDYYWKVIGKTKYDPSLDNLLLIQRPFDGNEKFSNENEYDKKILCNYTFDTYDEYWNFSYFDSTQFVSPNLSFRMDSSQIYSPDYHTPSCSFMKSDHAWIRVSAWVYPTEDLIQKPVWLIITFLHKTKCYKYFGSDKQSSELIPNQWNYICVDYLTPNIRNPKDELQVYFWSLKGQTVYIDNMKVFAFTPKDTN